MYWSLLLRVSRDVLIKVWCVTARAAALVGGLRGGRKRRPDIHHHSPCQHVAPVHQRGGRLPLQPLATARRLLQP